MANSVPAIGAAVLQHCSTALTHVHLHSQATRRVVVKAKEGIHPEWFGEAPVICNGQEVMTVGGTKPQYNVDLYSGNHPFYQGFNTAVVIDEGQLNKFKRRFADLGELSTVVTANEAVAAGDSSREGGPAQSAPAPSAKGKGKKKK